MYIISVLDVQTNEVQIYNVENDLLTAQDNFLDKVSELSHPNDDKSVVRECVFLAKDRVNIYEKVHGWTTNYKRLVKIITMHFVRNCQVIECESDE
jgi:hypothetical protein